MDTFLKNAYDMLYLTACGLGGITPEADRIERMDYDGLYRLCSFHNLSAIVCTPLEKSGIHHREFSESKAKAIRKNMLLDAERAEILAYMEKEGIWHMPLKGVILKDIYPSLGMRQMSDNDILFDEGFRQTMRDYMTARGYTVKSYGKGNHDEYHKPPVYNFELHTALFNHTADKKWTEYYSDVKSRLVKDDDNGYGYHFTREDFYIYMIMHEYKHFSGGGTGLRSLCDSYLYNKKYGDILDREHISSVLKALGADDFEMKSRMLGEKVLSSAALPSLTDDERSLLEYYLTSGTYGTSGRANMNRIERYRSEKGTTSRAGYFFRRIFPDMNFYKSFYPVCYKYKVLIPFAWTFRLVRGVTVRNRKLKDELRAVKESGLK